MKKKNKQPEQQQILDKIFFQKKKPKQIEWKTRQEKRHRGPQIEQEFYIKLFLLARTIRQKEKQRKKQTGHLFLDSGREERK